MKPIIILRHPSSETRDALKAAAHEHIPVFFKGEEYVFYRGSINIDPRAYTSWYGVKEDLFEALYIVAGEIDL